MLLLRFKNILILTLLILFACKSKTETKEVFDKTRWQATEGNIHPHRNKMFDDLMQKRPWVGKNQQQVLQILGQPDRSTPGYIYYTVKQEFVVEHFPMHTKSLVIKFGADSLVEWAKIHE